MFVGAYAKIMGYLYFAGVLQWRGVELVSFKKNRFFSVYWNGRSSLFSREKISQEDNMAASPSSEWEDAPCAKSCPRAYLLSSLRVCQTRGSDLVFDHMQ